MTVDITDQPRVLKVFQLGKCFRYAGVGDPVLTFVSGSALPDIFDDDMGFVGVAVETPAFLDIRIEVLLELDTVCFAEDNCAGVLVVVCALCLGGDRGGVGQQQDL